MTSTRHSPSRPKPARTAPALGITIAAVGHCARQGIASACPLVVLTIAFMLNGCSTTVPSADSLPSVLSTGARAHWSGRLALQLHNGRSLDESGQNDGHSYSASFALHGTPEHGSLHLSGPFGTLLAQLQWEPGRAWLLQGGGNAPAHSSPSLTQLLRSTLGVDIPIATLFAWLHGQAHEANGWRADLSRYSTGRITAHSQHPAATLRVILDSP